MREKIISVFQDTCIFAAQKHTHHVWRLNHVYDKNNHGKHESLNLGYSNCRQTLHR